jgi:hypothetical protein
MRKARERERERCGGCEGSVYSAGGLALSFCSGGWTGASFGVVGIIGWRGWTRTRAPAVCR